MGVEKFEGNRFFGPFGIPFQDELPTEGAVIVEVVENSPADATGLQAGDIIKAADGIKIDTNRP